MVSKTCLPIMLYYLCRNFREADLRLVFAYAKRWFSHTGAHSVKQVHKMKIHDYGL